MDRQDFQKVYDDHYDDIWRFLVHTTADVQLSMELTSRTFFRAFRAWAGYRHTAPARIWLLRIAVNEWRRELRRRKISRFIPFSLAPTDHDGEIICDQSEVDSVAAEIERDESYQMLRRALEALAPTYRLPLLLKYFEHMSIEEVANILGRPVGTVKSLLHRGIAKLRQDQGLREACGVTISEATPLSAES